MRDDLRLFNPWSAKLENAVMATSSKGTSLPEGYVPLAGSEKHPLISATLLGPADDTELLSCTIALRRRIDGPPLPDLDHFTRVPWDRRKRYSVDELTESFGAHPDDALRVARFAEASGLKVHETHLGRRTVVVSGSVARMNRAFAVTLNRYQHTTERYRGRKSYAAVETYRGRDGPVSVPRELVGIVTGVFGLDNRNISRRSLQDPPNTVAVTIPQVTGCYKFPGNSASGQTIGIVSTTGQMGGYFQSDLDQFFGASVPLVTPISCFPAIPVVPDDQCNGSIEMYTTQPTPVGSATLYFGPASDVNSILVGSRVFSAATPGFNTDGISFYLAVTAVDPVAGTVTMNQTVVGAELPGHTLIYFNPDSETTQDICIAAAAAKGANIAVFFSGGGEEAWATTIGKAVLPDPGYPLCSVLSSSWYMSGGDDDFGLSLGGLNKSVVDYLTEIFRDAALLGDLTICICTGDWGSNGNVGYYEVNTNPPTFKGDGNAHVNYPASDPWVLAVGGTTIGNIGFNGDPTSFQESVWNDDGPPAGAYQKATTGGGVSNHFPLPPYQANAGVPPYVSDPSQSGRGIPDVAANASGSAGYGGLFVGGLPDFGNGTSASTPLWAGLIALINAALGEHVGFINPSLYGFGSSVFNSVNPPADGSEGATNNGNSGIAGYNSSPGWDACTGWGSPNGGALLNAFKAVQEVFVFGGYQSPDIILSDPSTGSPVALGGMPGGPWDTLLVPSTQYGLSVNVHNDSPAAVEVQVKFWQIPGGVGVGGPMLGSQNLTIPPYNYGTATCPGGFMSAPLGEHSCAAVSIYGPSTECGVNPMDATYIPDPGLSDTHACSAWRNTDSMFGIMGEPFNFGMGLGPAPEHLPLHVLVQVRSTHVPLDWDRGINVKEWEEATGPNRARNNVPRYLLPKFMRTFRPIQIKAALKMIQGGAMEEKGPGRWNIVAGRDSEKTSFELSGEIPAGVARGDIVLVHVTAHYPAIGKRAGRSVEFLQVIHIRDGSRPA